ncbi:hypothetical protein P879_01641 [Paragonimus westermani]|uniref:18 kDa Sin3-associated polypeptide n=1 Tax=Paragonimus westermani TaxID=34504 RepID=A0A8T0DU65_9TREM|nr:hypothetical protein P879_01641 [Paragonimus westermani]
MTMTVDDGSINREKTCPLLLRMFYSSVKHNSVMEYSRGRTPNNELQVYTWLDATLRELASLVKQVNPEARKRGTVFDFALVSPDLRSPVYRMRELGVVCAGSPSDADRIMLKDCQFTIGDMIDIAISPPSTQSEAAPYYSMTVNSAQVGRVVRRPSPPFGRGRRDYPVGSNRFDRDTEVTRRTVIDNVSRERMGDYQGGNRPRYEQSGNDRRRLEASNRSSRRGAPY